MFPFLFGFFLMIGSAVTCFASSTPAEVVPVTTVNVQVERDTPMKVGKAVRGKLVYALYVDNQLAIPAGAELAGKVSALAPASSKARRSAMLGGDFSPMHRAQIRFDELILPGGKTVTIDAVTVGEGAQVVRFTGVSATGHHPSLVRRLWADAVGREKGTIHAFTAPGKKDRARRLLYSELPYHPETLLAGTQYSVQFAKRLRVPASMNAPVAPKHVDTTFRLNAALADEISSKDAVPGTRIKAVVTDPLFNSQHELQVPQGSVLVGEITQARPAGRWGRGGLLRFSFRELQFPAGFTQAVHGAPTSVDADQNANLELDAEGGVKPGHKGAAVPIIMGLLAASAVHEDEATVLHTAGASNGFALIGRVLALATKSTYVGAAFGFYGTGRAVTERYIVHGSDVTFPRNTRIEVLLDPERVNTLKPTFAPTR